MNQEARKSNSETPEQSVARLRAAQEENEGETTPEAPTHAPPGDHELLEAEALTLENLELKQEIYQQRLRALEFEMTGLVERVRKRLDVAEENNIQFARNRLHVRIFEKQE